MKMVESLQLNKKKDSSSTPSEDVLLQAVRYGKYRTVTQLLCVDTQIDVNRRDSQGFTPLLLAVLLEQNDIRNHLVKLLISRSADVNLSDENGVTSLMVACQDESKTDSVRAIIKVKHCQINQQDKEGNTALSHAAINKNKCAIRTIVNSSFTKKTINLTVVNKKGLSPLEISIEQSDTESILIFIVEGNFDPKTISSRHRDLLQQLLDQVTGFSLPKEQKNIVDQLVHSSVAESQQRNNKESISSTGCTLHLSEPSSSNGLVPLSPSLQGNRVRLPKITTISTTKNLQTIEVKSTADT